MAKLFCPSISVPGRSCLRVGESACTYDKLSARIHAAIFALYRESFTFTACLFVIAGPFVIVGLTGNPDHLLVAKHLRTGPFRCAYKSIDYISRSLHAAELLGADTIVIHAGSAAQITRKEAMKLAADTLEKNLEVNGATEIRMGIETMGKVNQLGNLDEVIELCRLLPKYHPVVDFGHLNARHIGSYFTGVDSYRAVFDKIANLLGDEYAFNLHCHFSKIEYTGAGEKRHLTFADTVYGPDFEPLAEAIIREGVAPRIICESDGTMAEDALNMKNIYKQYK